jgi:hypothetical protein
MGDCWLVGNRTQLYFCTTAMQHKFIYVSIHPYRLHYHMVTSCELKLTIAMVYVSVYI